MSVKTMVFLATMVFAIMAAAANLPREAAEKAVVDVARGLGNQGFLGKIVARQMSSVDPIATSSVAASSTFSASRVTPSASTPVSSETPSPPAETNLATRNGGLDEAIIAGVAAFAALAAL
ncbi:predicted protein [Histoplasma capsulatum H143]|uniref:Uncharacterized protein n=1 Tax=Ajellomyces capsulatus (strain H143) TaxID=544712 RepID=C6HC42_AJECH|nr:predicted protein [Histoplasma capsulatum H143]